MHAIVYLESFNFILNQIIKVRFFLLQLCALLQDLIHFTQTFKF